MNLRDGTTVDDPRLDRLEEFDEASRDFRIGAVTDATQPLTTKLWTIPDTEAVLDQGPDGACVGFGVTNELRFNPVPITGLNEAFAKQSIYWQAQRMDQWPGGSYPGATPVYEGTSVLAGIKVATKMGFYGEYRWAFTEPELAAAIPQFGPSVIGIPWTTTMFHPDAKGFLRPTGKVAGGHCVLVIGITITGSTGDGYYTIYNSWGGQWGDQGTAKISRRNLAKLLKQNGDACIITRRTHPNPIPAAR
jgi:hypothetical protein